MEDPGDLELSRRDLLVAGAATVAIGRIRIGATREGTITASGHENWSGDLPGGAVRRPG